MSASPEQRLADVGMAEIPLGSFLNDGAAGEKSEQDAQRLCPIGLEDFLTRPFPVREMVLGPWLPVAGLAMLYAPRGVGKTHVALNVAYAAASGGRFLKWQAPKPRRARTPTGWPNAA
jgi:hypothetical protein